MGIRGVDIGLGEANRRAAIPAYAEHPSGCLNWAFYRTAKRELLSTVRFRLRRLVIGDISRISLRWQSRVAGHSLAILATTGPCFSDYFHTHTAELNMVL